MRAWHELFSRRGAAPQPAASKEELHIRIVESVRELSIEEWLLLAYCVQRNQQTIALDVVHPAAGALVAKGLLARSGSINDGAAWPYTVPQFIWEHLQERPRLLFEIRGIAPDDAELETNLGRLDKYLMKFDAVER